MNVAPRYGSILSLKRTALFAQVLGATVGLISRSYTRKNSERVKVLIFASDLSLHSQSSASSLVLKPRLVVRLGVPFASLNRHDEIQHPADLSSYTLIIFSLHLMSTQHEDINVYKAKSYL